MENNEISMYMDVKLEIHDKRPDSLRFKNWSRCLVKIEAIKCLPCFLRITFKRNDNIETDDGTIQQLRTLNVSINVPGVSLSLATSRTKQHSYGLFWTQNRHNCFIYFALETEISCRSHMKWIKKSIKNLELHRQVFLEQRRSSRIPPKISKNNVQKSSTPPTELGPLPKIPDFNDLNNVSCSQRVSRASEIYEEIFENSLPINENLQNRPSRRISRCSIASGIYEEMKPTNIANFRAILEECVIAPEPPPLPSLPRKRLNTLEADNDMEIPRSNTNPESDLVKKKKYKNIIDNFLGNVRSKRSDSVSEGRVSNAADLIKCDTPEQEHTDINDATNVNFKRTHKSNLSILLTQSKRNSFSSPDLSKINFLDTFDEDRVLGIFNNSFSTCDDLDLSIESINELITLPTNNSYDIISKQPTTTKLIRMNSNESLNISEHISSNFNFSACNTSTINLIGSNGAGLYHSMQKNKIIIDDLAGYCVMAPIIKKQKPEFSKATPLMAIESASSGYSTSSYSSTSSTNYRHVIDEPIKQLNTAIIDVKNTTITDDSQIYENMNYINNSNVSSIEQNEVCNNFADNLYENLLAIKAAQELENLPGVMSTSTPTDSPHTLTIESTGKESPIEVENFYQTPRKSIISVDEKISSYYPNSCDNVKMRRSPAKSITPTSSLEHCNTNTLGLRQLVNKKMHQERKENFYISSPQKIMDKRYQRTNETTTAKDNTPKTTASTIKLNKLKKFSGNIYTVSHLNRKSTNNINNNKDIVNGFTDDIKGKLQSELLQLAMMQKIDFKFDDIQDDNEKSKDVVVDKVNITPQRMKAQHHLQVNQAENTNVKEMPTVIVTPDINNVKLNTSDDKVTMGNDGSASATNDLQWIGVKKFASLPRFKKIDFSPLKLKINNVLQRNQ